VVHCDALWCSVVQCGAVWCSVLQRGAVLRCMIRSGGDSGLQCAAVGCSVVQWVAVWFSVLHCLAVCCIASFDLEARVCGSVVLFVELCCRVLQYIAVYALV